MTSKGGLALVAALVADLRRLVQLELALAKELVRRGIRPLTRSAAFAVGAIVVGFLGVLCAVGAAVAALSLVLPLWLSFVLVMLVLFLAGIGLAVGASRAYKQGSVELSSAIAELRRDASWRPDQMP
jgi:uncharacterized membrane protein YphA (DoxX/SURF4 family)